jgi:hypothetical protein
MRTNSEIYIRINDSTSPNQASSPTLMKFYDKKQRFLRNCISHALPPEPSSANPVILIKKMNPAPFNYDVSGEPFFGTLKENEVKNLLQAALQILEDYDNVSNPIPILPIFFKLFSSGFPFILWCEFLRFVRIESRNVLIASIPPHIWNTLRKMARLQGDFNELYGLLPEEEDPSKPNDLVKCGISEESTIENWTAFIMHHVKDHYHWMFSRHEIYVFIYALLRTINKSVKHPIDTETNVNRE